MNRLIKYIITAAFLVCNPKDHAAQHPQGCGEEGKEKANKIIAVILDSFRRFIK